MDIYDGIKNEIIKGILKPGEKIVEKKLSEKFGVSRTPIREALRKLEANNFVVYYPNRGTSVKFYTKNDINNIYNLRSILEGYAAYLAAKNVTEEYGELLKQANWEYKLSIQRYMTAKNERTIFNLMSVNHCFHNTIMKMSANNYIKSMLSSVTISPLVYQSYYQYSEKDIDSSITHHENIESAISRGDAEEAKILMSAHIYHGRKKILKLFNT